MKTDKRKEHRKGTTKKVGLDGSRKLPSILWMEEAKKKRNKREDQLPDKKS